MDFSAGEKFYYSQNDYLNYLEIGKGPVHVLFLHGFGASLHTWSDILPYFEGDTFTVTLIDLKGFGLSSKAMDSDFSMVAKFILGFTGISKR